MNKRGETWAGEVGSLLEEGKEARYINGRKKKKGNNSILICRIGYMEYAQSKFFL